MTAENMPLTMCVMAYGTWPLVCEWVMMCEWSVVYRLFCLCVELKLAVMLLTALMGWLLVLMTCRKRVWTFVRV